jgi:hypothetical protein
MKGCVRATRSGSAGRFTFGLGSGLSARDARISDRHSSSTAPSAQRADAGFD